MVPTAALLATGAPPPPQTWQHAAQARASVGQADFRTVGADGTVRQWACQMSGRRVAWDEARLAAHRPRDGGEEPEPEPEPEPELLQHEQSRQQAAREGWSSVGTGRASVAKAPLLSGTLEERMSVLQRRVGRTPAPPHDAACAWCERVRRKPARGSLAAETETEGGGWARASGHMHRHSAAGAGGRALRPAAVI